MLLLFVLAGYQASAQRSHFNSMRVNYDGAGQSDYAITGGAFLDAPGHNLKELYKASPGFEAGVLRYKDNFVFGLHAGYRAFRPKQAVFYDVDEYGGEQTGAVTLSNYSSVMIYASAAYELKLSPQVQLSAGVNVGNYFSHVRLTYDDFTYEDYDGYQNFSVTESQAYVAPKIGINFALSEDVQLNLHARYNVFGNYSYSYNSRYGDESSGVLYTSFAGGLSLTYRFP